MTNNMAGRDAVTIAVMAAYGLGDISDRPNPEGILPKVAQENANGTCDDGHMGTWDLYKDGHRDCVHNPGISLEAGTLQTLLKNRKTGEHTYGAHTCKLMQTLYRDFLSLGGLKGLMKYPLTLQLGQNLAYQDSAF